MSTFYLSSSRWTLWVSFNGNNQQIKSSRHNTIGLLKLKLNVATRKSWPLWTSSQVNSLKLLFMALLHKIRSAIFIWHYNVDTCVTVVSDWLLLWQNERYTSLNKCEYIQFRRPFHKTNHMRWLMDLVLCNRLQPSYQFDFSNIRKMKDFKIRTRPFHWTKTNKKMCSGIPIKLFKPVNDSERWA